MSNICSHASGSFQENLRCMRRRVHESFLRVVLRLQRISAGYGNDQQLDVGTVLDGCSLQRAERVESVRCHACGIRELPGQKPHYRTKLGLSCREGSSFHKSLFFDVTCCGKRATLVLSG